VSTLGSRADRRITAVIPTYNRGPLVERAIESALAQEHPPHEIVVVDDGSTDGTGERLARFDDRVRYVSQENAGDAAARNRGVEEAATEWVAFLDSDDTWTEDHLARMHVALERTGGRADVYFSDTRLAPYDGGEGTRVWDDASFSIADDHELVEDGTQWALLRIQPMMLQSSMFNRTAFREAGGLLRDVPPRADTHLFYAMSIGRPVCAVAGIGCIMTADDTAGTRLTAQYNEYGTRYWTSSVTMYRELLARDLPLDAAGVRFFEEAEAVAQWRLARIAGSERAARPFVRHLARSFRLDPRGFIRRLLPQAG
jgi:glycosyltransferase involved in cell wall biosynthesis